MSNLKKDEVERVLRAFDDPKSKRFVTIERELQLETEPFPSNEQEGKPIIEALGRSVLNGASKYVTFNIDPNNKKIIARLVVLEEVKENGDG